MFKDFFEKLGHAFERLDNLSYNDLKQMASSARTRLGNAANYARRQAGATYGLAKNVLGSRRARRAMARIRRSFRRSARFAGNAGRRGMAGARWFGGAVGGGGRRAASAGYGALGRAWNSIPRLPRMPSFGSWGGGGSSSSPSSGGGGSGSNSLSNLITRAGRGGLAGVAWNTLLNSANQTGVNASGPTGSMAGSISTGAGRGAALAYASGSAAAVPLGITALTASLTAAPKAVQSFVATIVESRRTLANLNGQYAAAYAKLDVHRMSRNISLASMTGDSSSRLVGALDSLENKLMPMAALTMNVVNEIAVDVANMASGMMDIVNTLPYVKDFTELFLRNPNGEGLRQVAQRIAIGAFERRKPPAPPAKPGKK